MNPVMCLLLLAIAAIASSAPVSQQDNQQVDQQDCSAPFINVLGVENALPFDLVRINFAYLTPVGEEQALDWTLPEIIPGSDEEEESEEDDDDDEDEELIRLEFNCPYSAEEQLFLESRFNGTAFYEVEGEEEDPTTYLLYSFRIICHSGPTKIAEVAFKVEVLTEDSGPDEDQKLVYYFLYPNPGNEPHIFLYQDAEDKIRIGVKDFRPSEIFSMKKIN